MCKDDKNISALVNNNCKDRAWIEIDLKSLKHNVMEIQRILGDSCEFMAVVKANAYGHGSLGVAEYLNNIGVNCFAVATIDEAIELRNNGIKGNILILGYTNPDRFCDLVSYDLIQSIVDYNYALEMKAFDGNIRAHIKVDTGMCRLGENVKHIDKINEMFDMKNLKIEAIFSHLHVADSMIQEDIDYTHNQIKEFYDLADSLRNVYNRSFKTHLMNSYAAIDYPELAGDYARIGICMYGVKSSISGVFRNNISLSPVLSLRARIAAVKEINEHDGVSYGRDFIAEHKMKIAAVTIGYADGYPRCISNKNAYVLINGKKAPILGRICMDQLIVDVTDIDNVNTGSVATLIGKSGDEYISVEEVAEKADTITNELLSRLSVRLKRYFKQ